MQNQTEEVHHARKYNDQTGENKLQSTQWIKVTAKIHGTTAKAPERAVPVSKNVNHTICMQKNLQNIELNPVVERQVV